MTGKMIVVFILDALLLSVGINILKFITGVPKL